MNDAATFSPAVWVKNFADPAAGTEHLIDTLPRGVFWLFLLAVSLVVILSLYVLKAALFDCVSSPRRVLMGFLIGIVLAVPVTWFITPDWNSPEMAPIAKWVSMPVILLTVPCLSFFYDYANGRRSKGRWYIRVPLEVCIAGPLWAFVWLLLEINVFRWWLYW